MTADEPYADDLDSTARALPDVRPQEGRWRTTAVPAPIEAVRTALSTAVRHGRSFGDLTVKGLSTQRGFVLTCTIGKRKVGAELELAASEAGTQVHLVVPSDPRPREAELDRLLGWLKLVLAEGGWQTA